MLSRVSSHCVIRYMERVLGLPVDAWLAGMEHLGENLKALHCCERAGLPVDAWLAGMEHLGENLKALHCCERAGLPVDAVRASIMHPAIIRVCLAGFKNIAVRLDGFVFIINEGTIVTVMTHRMYVATMGTRYGSPRVDPSKKRRKAQRRLAEVV